MSHRNEPVTADPISSRDLVAAVLARSLAVVNVFMRRRMACPGCAMAQYMTIGDAAKVYGLDPEAFVLELEAELHRADRPHPRHERGATP